MAGRRTADPSARARLRRPPAMLSGLTRCGWCGGSYTSLNRKRLICSAHRERGPTACTNSRHVARAEIERRVLDGLQDKLLSPAAVAAYVRAYHEAWNAQAAEAIDLRRPAERRLGEVERAITRAVDALLSGSVTASAVGPRLALLESEQAELKATLADLEKTTQPPPIALHPRAADAYAVRIGKLQETMAEYAASDRAPDRETIAAVRDLIDHIDIEPESSAKGAPVRITLHGQLERLLKPADPMWVSDGAPGGGRTHPRLGERTVKIAV